ncbi:MAG: hypothetical protein RLZZ251_227 [Actinomycetota bacterium]
MLHGLTVKIRELEKKLKRRDLSEWDKRWSEYKLVEAKFWLWAELQGWEERQKARHSDA